jgi:hypothetical protein
MRDSTPCPIHNPIAASGLSEPQQPREVENARTRNKLTSLSSGSGGPPPPGLLATCRAARNRT